MCESRGVGATKHRSCPLPHYRHNKTALQDLTQELKRCAATLKVCDSNLPALGKAPNQSVHIPSSSRSVTTTHARSWRTIVP